MDSLFNNTYNSKKVLITGHTGFKGSWLALWLRELGADVVGYSVDVPSTPSHFELLGLDVPSVMDDILNEQKLFETIETHKPDIIFHMAAQALVRESYVSPAKTFATNIMGTVNVLESCRKLGSVKAVLNITSDKCYHNNESGQAYKEDDALGGRDPYSASKGASEIVANSYRNSFFHPDEFGKKHTTLLADVRAGNVIGGGDWAKDRLIPDLAKAASENGKMIIRNPKATRPWQHVLEPLSGYLHLGSKLLEGKKEFADNWNFGPAGDSSLTVHEMIEQAKDHWEKIDYEIREDPANVHEASLLELDSSKARTRLKWKSIWDDQKSLAQTINWYKNHYQNASLLSANDLDDYVRDAKASQVEWAVA